jgi:glycosyltransferase involved in cell wall biosynthesis
MRKTPSSPKPKRPLARRPREIWVAGSPGRIGGADTELLHLCDLWKSQGIDVHVVPVGGMGDDARHECERSGWKVDPFTPDVFRDRLVVSLCNGEFLKRLPEIAAEGKPRAVVWANCMTWLFDAEKEAHRQGLIDHFLFQSQYQRNRLLPELQQIRPVHELPGYRPFFHLKRWRREQGPHPSRDGQRSRPRDYFGIGRVSRDDGAKYHPDTWRMLAKVSAPIPVKAFLLGFGENAQKRCGSRPPCEWLDWMYWAPGAIPAGEFYQRIHVLMHLTGGSRENWPRTVLEAWASGVVPIVDADFGVQEMVTSGQDGYCVPTAEAATFAASMLAFDERLRKRMVAAGLETLKREHCDVRRSMKVFEGVL